MKADKRVSNKKIVRRAAREAIGQPPPTRTIPNKRFKAVKHKKRLLEDETEKD